MNRFGALVRDLHLLAGLGLALLVGFYAISGAAIAYARWIPAEPPAVSVATIGLPPDLEASDTAAMHRLAAATAGAGVRLQSVEREDDGRVRFRFVGPGRSVEMVSTPGTGGIQVTSSRFGPVRVLRMLHTTTAYEGGLGFATWALLQDLASLAVIGFALSGIYLWYRRTRDRRGGWAILLGSWAYTIGLVVYFAIR